MTSKERVRAALSHKAPDRVPAAFEATYAVSNRLIREYGFDSFEKLYEKFEADIRPVYAGFIGEKDADYIDTDGYKVTTDFWGCKRKYMKAGKDYANHQFYYPLAGIDTVEGLESFKWPDPAQFNYEGLKRSCEQHKDKALIFGHEGPFHVALSLRPMEEFMMDMIAEPEYAEKVFSKMLEFELEYYERALIAADGQIDIIRPHDDYGTQRGLLFSAELWRKYIKANTKKLTDLAHKYGAFYQQHSCGAVSELIPDMIEAGVDCLEPLQKVPGLEPENLQKQFGGKITFHGGIDTQTILPYGTPEEVEEEARHYISTLHQNGGYILMASQVFENDVPTENIEALYKARF